MNLQFQSNDLEGQQWQQRTANRLRLALGRLHGLVTGMKVSLDDVNGPAGGVDKRCDVEVLVHGSGGPVAVSATARTWQGCVEAVAPRLRQRVVVELHRATVTETQTMAVAPVRTRAGATDAGARPLRRLRRP